MVFAVQVLPVAVLAVFGSLAGASVIASRLPASMTLPTLLVGLVLFVAMLTFRDNVGWNTALLVGFGLAAGIYLRWAFPESAGGQWPAAIATGLVILSVAAAVGPRGGQRLAWLGPGVWALSWIYLVGWIALAWLRLGRGASVGWAAAGLLVFGILSMIWFGSQSRRPARVSATSLAIDLYILGLNLVVAARVILGAATGH
jgi:hypothetical protein